MLSLLYHPNFTSIHDYWKPIAFIIWTFVGKVTSLLFNTPSRFVRASLIAQLVKNPPAMQETVVQFLGWEDLLEKE